MKKLLLIGMLPLGLAACGSKTYYYVSDGFDTWKQNIETGEWSTGHDNGSTNEDWSTGSSNGSTVGVGTEW